MAEARYRILTLNNISPRGLERLPAARYVVGDEIDDPDAMLVRSADMHAPSGQGCRARSRAGAGVNNIPVGIAWRAASGVNAPGANANAVKELVVAGMLLAARRSRLVFARDLEATIRHHEAAEEKGSATSSDPTGGPDVGWWGSERSASRSPMRRTRSAAPAHDGGARVAAVGEYRGWRWSLFAARTTSACTCRSTRPPPGNAARMALTPRGHHPQLRA